MPTPPRTFSSLRQVMSAVSTGLLLLFLCCPFLLTAETSLPDHSHTVRSVSNSVAATIVDQEKSTAVINRVTSSAPTAAAVTTDHVTSTEVTITERVTTTEKPVTNQTIIVTGCSQGRPLPPSASVSDRRTLVLELDNHTEGGVVNCSWVVPSFSNTSSTVFTFHSSLPVSACNDTNTSYSQWDYVTFSTYSLFDSVIADSCSRQDWEIPNSEGSRSLIRFVSNNSSLSRVTVGTYWSVSWPQNWCPQNDDSGHSFPFLKASTTPVDLLFPGQGLRIPPATSCTWTIQSPDPDGEVNIKIHGHDTDPVESRCGPWSSITVRDENRDASGGFVISTCEKNLDLRFKSVNNIIDFVVSTWIVLSSQGFTLTYWAEPRDNVCPTSPLHLSAQPGHSQLFKGVNMLSGKQQLRQCFWQLEAPEPDMVVRLDSLTARDYIRCDSNDTLVLENGETLTMCDFQRFPIWSEGQTTTLQFNAREGSEGRQFVVQYTAVPKATCQGHPTALTATLVVKTFILSTLHLGHVSDNRDCRWIFNTNISDHVLQVSVRPTRERIEPCYSANIHGYDGVSPHKDDMLQADCPSNANTMVFTSHRQTMLLIVQRYRSMGNVRIQYQVVSLPTGGGNGPRPSVLASVLVGVWAVVGAFYVTKMEMF